MPDPRCGFRRARDIGTESSKGSFAILFMATSHPRQRYTTGSDARLSVVIGRRRTMAIFAAAIVRELYQRTDDLPLGGPSRSVMPSL
jgi:hypothetical protein